MLRHLSLAVLLLLATLACGRERRWNVLLFTFDTTRADFLGCYGRETAQTPHLDRLAADGFLFEHAYASNPVTQASHSTILTGVYPMVHGVRDNTFFHLPESRQTLAELLKAEGYDTGAAVGGFPLTAEFGTAQGFDLYDDELTASRSDFRGRPAHRRFATWYDERPAAHVNDAILPWLRQPRRRPFFAWLHYWDPHEPHIAPAPYGQLFAHDPYQGEIAYADESLGAILRELEALGELERTLIVMTADHGEGRREHREVTHAFLAYDTTLQVPLIVWVPGQGAGLEGGRRIAERVGTVDIVPTVLDLLGIEPPAEIQGRSLRPLMEGRSLRNERPYYAESLSPRLSHGFGELRALFLGPWKYIHGPRPELFHLDDDPKERDNRIGELPDEAARLETLLAGFLAAHRSAEAGDAAHEASEETRRRLAALGYLSAGGDGPQPVSEELRSDGDAPQDRVGDINLLSRLQRELGAGSFQRAEATARRLLDGSPQNPFYRASLARALVGLDRISEAAALVEEAERISAANAEPFVAVAWRLFEGGDREAGLALARRLAGSEESAATQLLLGRLLLESGDEAGGEEALLRALELDDGHREARLELVRHLTAEGHLERSEEVLQPFLEAYPADAEGHLAYARLLQQGEDPEGALERLERGLRLAPTQCEAQLERVELLAELGRHLEAPRALAELRRRCRDEEIRRRAEALVSNAS